MAVVGYTSISTGGTELQRKGCQEAVGLVVWVTKKNVVAKAVGFEADISKGKVSRKGSLIARMGNKEVE